MYIYKYIYICIAFEIYIFISADHMEERKSHGGAKNNFFKWQNKSLTIGDYFRIKSLNL